ncbi:hypothetical protein [Ureibacillus manganicus]|uniref:Uncharacterized protein n=1 Tax=Ureibacillus manganicus DSM 26584 TaxID=1384049 RepID=A0A0A3HZS0_9BACL|nr:hypothetical protein [Ureibacillus manganicus]KGR75863.1 hypothetical protein CD29_17535 [Ureibacillus manganicus DSM 26584]
MSKNKKPSEDFIQHLFVHMNEIDQFVIFSGLSLKQFVSAFNPMTNLLLLKHSYEDGSFNMHTQMDFVSKEDVQNFVKRVSDSTNDLCWIDFADEKGLNKLSPMEQAKLLYLSHKKEPIGTPFSEKLSNRFVYHSSNSEKAIKIYFRNLDDAEILVTHIFNSVIKEKLGSGGLFRKRTNSTFPIIDPDFLKAYRPYAKDGALLSLIKLEKPKRFEIEVRALVDYDFPDEVWDDLDVIINQSYDDLIKIP